MSDKKTENKTGEILFLVEVKITHPEGGTEPYAHCRGFAGFTREQMEHAIEKGWYKPKDFTAMVSLRGAVIDEIV